MIELNKMMLQARANKYMVFFFNIDNTYVGAERSIGSNAWKFGIWTINKSKFEFDRNIDYLNDTVDSIVHRETLISFFKER